MGKEYQESKIGFGATIESQSRFGGAASFLKGELSNAFTKASNLFTPPSPHNMKLAAGALAVAFLGLVVKDPEPAGKAVEKVGAAAGYLAEKFQRGYETGQERSYLESLEQQAEEPTALPDSQGGSEIIDPNNLKRIPDGSSPNTKPSGLMTSYQAL